MQEPGLTFFSCSLLLLVGATVGQLLGQPPRITEAVRRVRQLEGRSAYFWCRVTGNPTPTVVWYRNDRRVDNARDTASRRASFSRVFKHSSGGSVLLIERVSRNDSALYTCSVRIDSDSPPLNSSAALEVLPLQQAPVGVYPLFVTENSDTRLSYDRDARIELPCRVNSSEPTTVFWFKDQLILFDLQESSGRSAKRYKDADGSLIIIQAAESDSGMYHCVVLTESNWMASSQASSVMVKPRTSSPSFLVVPTDQEVSTGADLNLTCVAIGNPVPKVQWFNRNVVVSLEQSATDRLVNFGTANEEAARTVTGPASGRAIAMMKNLVATDNYTCIAESHFGTVQRTISVRVRERPRTPANFSLMQYTATSVTFNWQVPPTSSAEPKPFTFIIEWHETRNSSAAAQSANCSAPPITIGSLRPFTSYQFRVLTVGEIATSVPTDFIVVTTRETAPTSPPRDVRARVSSTTNSTIELTWLEPEEPNGPLVGYSILYVLADSYRLGSTQNANANANTRGRLPVSNWSMVEVGPFQKRVDLRGLIVDRTYRIAMNAKTQTGSGPLCEPIYVITNNRVPLQPTGLQALSTGISSFQLLWNAPAQNNVEVFAYVVYYNDSNQSVERIEYRVDSSQAKVFSHRLTGLKPGTEYTVRVSAKGIDGEGPLSEAVAAQTDEYKPSGSPTNLRTEPLNATALRLRFDELPSNSTNGRILQHRVYLFRLDASLVSQVPALRSALMFPFPSDFASVLLSSVLSNLTSASLRRQLDAESGGVSSSQRHFPPDELPIVLGDLSPFSRYLVCMTAANRVGESDPSDWILSFTTDSVPSAPSQLNVTAFNSSSITVYWLSPLDSQRHGVIKEYIITYLASSTSSSPSRAQAQGPAVQFKVPANSLENEPGSPPAQYQVVVNNLAPNTLYEVAVQAVTRKGDGLAARTKVRTPFASPDPPRSFVLSESVRSVGDTSAPEQDCALRATWLPPANIYGAPLLGYRLSYVQRESEPQTPGSSSIVINTQRSVEVNGTVAEISLYCGEWYDFALFARTRHGESKPTQKSFRVPERVPSGAPETAAFVAMNATAGLLSWTPPSPALRGGRIVSFALSCISMSDSGLSADTERYELRESTNQTTALLTSLQRNAQYHCQLQASTRVGSGPALNLSFVFNGEQPKSPNNIGTVRLNATSMRVSWIIPPQSISWITIHFVEASRPNVEFARWRKQRIPVATVCDVYGLVASESYLVRLTATASDGYESDPSSEYTVPSYTDVSETRGTVEVLDLLSTLVVDRLDATSVTINWTVLDTNSVRLSDVAQAFRVEYSCSRWYYDERGVNRTNPVQRWTQDVPNDQTSVTLNSLTPSCAYRISLKPVVKPAFAQRYNFATRHETACTLPGTPPPAGKPELRSLSILSVYFPAASGEYGTISYYFIVAVPNLLTFSKSEEMFSDDDLRSYLGQNDSIGVRVSEIAKLPAELQLSRVFGYQLAEGESYRLFVRAFIDPRSAIPPAPECARARSSTMLALADRVAHSNSRYSNSFIYKYTPPVASDAAFASEGQSMDRIVVIVGPIAGCFTIILLIVIIISIVRSHRRSQNNGHTRLDSHYGQPKQLDKAYLGSNGNGTSTLFSGGNSKIVEMQDVAMRQPLLGNSCLQPEVNVNSMMTASSFSNGNGAILVNGNAVFGNTSGDGPFVGQNGGAGFNTFPCNGNGAFSPCGTLQRGNGRSNVDGNVNVRIGGSGSSGATSDQNSGTTHVNSPATGNRLPIPVDQFRAHVERLKANENILFANEYESIDPGSHFTWEHSNAEANKTKNRYANVVAYDHSRVVLTQLLDQPHSDYINANFIDGYREQNAYIATQGPLPHTIADFWRMCWEQRSSIIVMMTKLEERSRAKCDQYWPNRGTHTYGDLMHVTLSDVQEFAYYVLRSFTIQLVGQAEKREVKHLQFTAWPDHGVPDHPATLLAFIRRVRSLYLPDMGPVIVHCSAGVGRTGAFIVVDSQLDRIRQEGSVDVFAHVTQLRGQRNYMVQTEDQYIFIHDSLLDAIEFGIVATGNSSFGACGTVAGSLSNSSGSFTEVPARALFAYLQKLRTANVVIEGSNAMVSGLEAQFRKLQTMRPDAAQCATASMPVNRFKNRLVNILPYENSRVPLAPLRGIDGSDYINASYIDGYRQRRMYIATQGCLPETIDDFWRMVWDKRSTIIVMLSRIRELGRDKCAQYWPVDRSVRFQHLIVEPTAEYAMPSYTLREFKMTDARDGATRTVRQFAFTEWPEQGVPKSGETFIEFIGQVHKTKEQFGQDGPITVHCGTGSGRTGVFIALSIILERLRYEGLVDVFQTIRMLRLQRAAMVQTEEQYQFVYSTVIEYLGSFDHYAT